MLNVPLASRMGALPQLALGSLCPEETLLVICDMVIGFAEHGALASPRVAALTPAIGQLLEQCRAKGIPAVAFADTHPQNAAEFERYPVHCAEGTDECEILPQLQEIGGYVTIPKNSTNGMLTEAFPQYLQTHPQCRTVLLCGCCTDICVMQFALTLKAYGDTNNHPYRIIVPEALTDTFDGPGHDGDTFHLLALQLMEQAGIELISEVSYGA